MKIAVQTEPIDIGREIATLTASNAAIGAVASFVGLVRDLNDGLSIATMTLEHYPGMTEKSLAAIVERAGVRWRLIDTTVVHRVGPLRPTDNIVLVAVASAHRGDAFDACQYIMDCLKTEAPFWKKESTAQGERWVGHRESDEAAARRWAQR